MHQLLPPSCDALVLPTIPQFVSAPIRDRPHVAQVDRVLPAPSTDLVSPAMARECHLDLMLAGLKAHDERRLAACGTIHDDSGPGRTGVDGQLRRGACR